MSARYFTEDNNTDALLLHACFDDPEKEDRTIGLLYDGNEDVRRVTIEVLTDSVSALEQHCDEVTAEEYSVVLGVDEEFRIGGIPKKPNLLS